MCACWRLQNTLALICLVALFLLPVLAQQPIERLTNKDILQMVQAQMSNEVIIGKIKRSRCNFDTDSTQLAELRSKGVSAEVLQAMVQAPFGLPSISNEQSQGRPEAATEKSPSDSKSITVIVPEGTFVFRNLSLETESYISRLKGELVNNTNKDWNDLTFRITALDSAGNEIKENSSLNELLLFGLKKNESQEISHIFSGFEQKPSRIIIAFSRGEYDAHYTFAMVKPKASDGLFYADLFVEITFAISKSQIGFVLRNKTDNPISLDWNQVSYIDITGDSHKVMHEGVKYISRSESQPASVIPPTAKLTDIVFPIDYVHYSSGQYGGWREDSLFPDGPLAEKYQNLSFSVFMPLAINGITKNYLFTFKIAKVET